MVSGGVRVKTQGKRARTTPKRDEHKITRLQPVTSGKREPVTPFAYWACSLMSSGSRCEFSYSTEVALGCAP